MRLLILSLSVIALTGCSSKGFKRNFDMVEKTVVIPKPSRDSDIQMALEKKPNLPQNMRIAVYFVDPPQTFDRRQKSKRQWRWTQDDKAIISDIQSHLTEKGIDAYVFPITSGLVKIEKRPDRNLKTIRLLAAKHGADAVLIVQGHAEVQRTANNLALSYFLILPALFVPGSDANTLFIASASLWDVRNEYLYLTAETEEAHTESYIPAFGKSDKVRITKAKTNALGQLRQQINNLILSQKSKKTTANQ